MNIDQWAADLCEVIVVTNNPFVGTSWYDKHSPSHQYEWTMNDPRCREVFVARWLEQNHKRRVEQYYNDSDDRCVAFITEHGKRIAYVDVDRNYDPWVDCIKALYLYLEMTNGR